jgi:hypothetical protein
VNVREKDRGASVNRSIDDDRTERKIDGAMLALVARKVKASRLVVEMGDPKALEPGRCFGEAAGKEYACRFQAIELQREFGTLIPHRIALAAGAAANDANRVGFEAKRLRYGGKEANRRFNLRKSRNTPSQGAK